MNVGQIFTQNALKLPAQEVILFKDKAYNYEETNRISNKLAAFFTERGIKNRDVVAVILSNCPEFAFIYFACMKTGAIFAPIDTKLSEQNIQGIAEEIKPALIFAEGHFPENHSLHSFTKTINISSNEFAAILQHPSTENFFLPVIDESETALYLHTSGTTSQPKIVELTYANLNCFPKAILKVIKLHCNFVWGMVLPMSHISGPIMLNLLISTNSKLAILDQFSPDGLFESIARHKINYFHAVPPIFNLMVKYNLSDKYNISCLDTIAMMGTSVPLSIMRAFKQSFPFVTLLQGYGLTETSPLITLTKREDADRKMNSIGTIVEDAFVQVVDENGQPVGINEIGELIVKGPIVMKGYLNADEENNRRFKNGYFYTNDLVKYDKENYFYHMGRADDLIVLHTGKKVYPAEIQNILLSHPKVVESATFGIYSKKEKGTIICSFLVSVKNMSLTENEIRTFCFGKLADYKVPKCIHFLEYLPKTNTGKIKIEQLKMKLESYDN